MRLLRLVPLVALLACTFAAGADAATRGPCIPGTSGPTCYHWEGRVTFVADGDTLDVDVSGDGTSTPIRVRVTGINAMEQTAYSRDPDRRRGYCHSLEATARLEQLLQQGGNHVRLSAQDPASRAGHRRRRAVSIRLGGQWVDLGQRLIDEGHALWLPNRKEWAHNVGYSRGSQVAAAAGRGIWETDYCGHGPDQDAPLKMWVNWDADGSDSPRYRGEWAKIKNFGDTDLNIAGWWFRDSHHRQFKFPSGAVIPAHGTVMVIIGRRPAGDSNRRTRFYWAQSNPVFDNAGSRYDLGDGGYLLDRQHDFRSWMIYPCRPSCTDPLRGKVIATAQPRAPEKVFLKNVGTTPANLEGYVVSNYPYVYSLPAHTVLQPRETLRLYVKGSPRNNTRLSRYWGKGKYILNDTGDVVSLRTQTNIRISCYDWGRLHC